jgi:hemoglobin-like flavoprotein
MKFFIIFALFVAGSYAALTAEEAGLVKSTWEQVRHNEIEILANFFQQHPELQARFPAFVGKDLAALKDTGKFAVHATRIVSELSEVIQLIGVEQNLPAIKTILNELGYTHKNRGITKEAFNAFRTSLISYLSHNVSWGDNVATAWNDGLDIAYNIIFSALDGHPVQ